jgi:hypothetical protein
MIYLLDLNYTLVSNQQQTRNIRPFSARLEAEEYRAALLTAIKEATVIIITARPEYQKSQTLANILQKTGWQPVDSYFNDIDERPPAFKESALKRFIFPKYGECSDVDYYAIESNPQTREMYAQYKIPAQPYDIFLSQKIGRQP